MTQAMARPVAGVDEAGRGCLAGPVVAAAVILAEPGAIPGLTDSKLLKPARREELAHLIRAQARAYALGLVWPRRIERVNILEATLQAMAKAVNRLAVPPALIQIDGNKTIDPRLLPQGLDQQAIVDGDLLVACISAASILAKTFRDDLMTRLDRRFPGYGLAAHKGYGTKAHLEALARLGPCRLHRMTFRGVLPPCDDSGPAKDQPCLPIP